ncbi:hypothetical protein ACJX0J_013735, partial [Zea mays]
HTSDTLIILSGHGKHYFGLFGLAETMYSLVYQHYFVLFHKLIISLVPQISDTDESHQNQGIYISICCRSYLSTTLGVYYGHELTLQSIIVLKIFTCLLQIHSGFLISGRNRIDL